MENMQVRHKRKPPSRESNPKRSCFAAAALIAAQHAAGQGLIHGSELFAEGFLFCCVGVCQKQSNINSCKINEPKDEPLNTTGIMMWVEEITLKDDEVWRLVCSSLVKEKTVG